jgi:hypothetical protein
MYSQWFDSESTDMQLSQQQLEALKAKFKSVQAKIAEHSNSLKQKESSLTEQEEKLQVSFSSLCALVFFMRGSYVSHISSRSNKSKPTSSS